MLLIKLLEAYNMYGELPGRIFKHLWFISKLSLNPTQFNLVMKNNKYYEGKVINCSVTEIIQDNKRENVIRQTFIGWCISETKR